MVAAAEAADDESSSSSAAASSSVASPSNRLKFLCSYGGKILPRPSDGRLKYVGGDTRVLVVPRSITFSELKERIHGMFQRCGIIKYQLVAEDLDDALVSVTCDEDITYMLDEYDRLDALHPRSPSAASSPRFRLFLFRSRPLGRADSAVPSHEHRYIDAASPRSPAFSVSTSPTGATSAYVDGPTAGFAIYPHVPTEGGGDGRMHRVHSAPKLGGGGMPRVHSTPNLGGVGGRGLPSQQHSHLHHHLPLQHHLLHGKQCSATPAPLPVAAYGAPAIGGGVAGNEVYCGLCVLCASQQVATAGLHHGGGCVCLRGHSDESSSSGRLVKRSSPTLCGVQSRNAFTWEQ